MASIFLPLQLMRRVSQAGKTFTSCSGQLSYSYQLLYYRWLSLVLPFHLERKASHAETIVYEQYSFPTLADCLTPVNSLIPADYFTPANYFSTAGPHPFCLEYLIQGRVFTN